MKPINLSKFDNWGVFRYPQYNTPPIMMGSLHTPFEPKWNLLSEDQGGAVLSQPQVTITRNYY